MTSVEFLTQTFGKLAYIDIAIIAVYMLLCLYVGYKSVGKIKTIKDFTLGSGSISTATLVATIYATHLGAGATIGSIERVSAIGLLFAITLFLKPISWWLSYITFGHNIQQFKGCITLVDVMEQLYGKLGRVMTLVGSLMDNIATLAAQAIALGYLLHYFLDIPIVTGLFIGMGTIIFYSTLGGVRAVVITDVLQFGIFYVVLPALCGLLLYETGGWEVVSNMIPAEKWNLSIDSTEKSYMFWGCVVYAIIPFQGAPFVQRFLMSMNRLQLKRSLTIIAFIDLTVVFAICIFGFILSTGIQGTVTSATVIWHMVNEELIFILKGLTIVGVIAIIMSTADSYLNVSGALIARNIYKNLFPHISDNIELITARVASIGVGILAVALALYGKGILHVIWIGISFFMVISAPLAIGALKFRTNSRSFLVSVIISLLGIFWGRYIQGSFDVLSTIFSLIGSTIGLFGMHYLQKVTGTLHNVAPPAIVEEVIEDTAFSYKKIFLGIRVFIKKCLFGLKYLKLKHIVSYSKLKVRKYHPRYYEFAIVGVIFSIYPLAFPNLIYGMSPKVAENSGLMTLTWLMDMVIRIATALGCIGLALQEKWKEENRKKYLPVYFHLVVMCTLSVLGTYSCLAFPKNYAFVVPGILAIFFLALLVDRLTFTIISLAGFILGNLFYLFFALVGEQPIIYGNIIGIELLYLFLALITAWLLHFVKDRQAQLEIDTWHKLAITDKLTNLYNRHYFDMRLESTLEQAKSRDRALSMMIIDIDHFKRINDNYGHMTGDHVIQSIAEYMLKSIRPGDICARIGGEEFVILMPETNLKKGEALAERLRLDIALLPFDVLFSSLTIRCTISIGLTQGLKDDTISSFKDRADRALYKAKTQGRNQFVSLTVEEKQIDPKDTKLAF